ncbi:glycosyl transferase [Dulcicalothrix desertica PCC 7102]|uniref:Glycosyl transferase n=1 Tax=Dulcicalothrix desertica PCC 7102 TaxID=232991 RepID=A0A433VAH2_9CYAN|nr:glycosyltransferase [Dulcicalothrix desertica]RUT03106.1 glycosyl transferase [Dulcicalothrix desertica PCC 7102]TWH53481.1 glycosyltransferase involved in cell wall biosynthesis [Dulcicalothrix desertica PCC 7102]
MKILYITTGLYTGGAEVMLYQLLTRINREKFSPVVLSLMDNGTIGERIQSLNIPVHTIDMEPGKPTLVAAWKLIRTVNEIKPDIIQGWMYQGNMAAQFANLFNFKKIPVIWCIHHSINSLKSEKILTQILIKLGILVSKLNYKVVFVSHNSKKQHEVLGYYPDNTCVIPNGFDTLHFQASLENKCQFRTELGLEPNTFLIGLICRYHPMKDHANFLKAAALLSEKFPHARFVLAGRDVDYSNQSLLELIQDLDISNKVYLLGERRDTSNIFSALDVLSVSSAYGEAFPLVIGEAMSCGIPCVVTNVGDSGWIVGNTGRVVQPRNPEALANAWQDLIAMGLAGREALGKAARERIINYFSLENIVWQYEKLYTEIIDKKSLIKIEYLKNKLELSSPHE